MFFDFLYFAWNIKLRLQFHHFLWICWNIWRKREVGYKFVRFIFFEFFFINCHCCIFIPKIAKWTLFWAFVVLVLRFLFTIFVQMEYLVYLLDEFGRLLLIRNNIIILIKIFLILLCAHLNWCRFCWRRRNWMLELILIFKCLLPWWAVFHSAVHWWSNTWIVKLKCLFFLRHCLRPWLSFFFVTTFSRNINLIMLKLIEELIRIVCHRYVFIIFYIQIWWAFVIIFLNACKHFLFIYIFIIKT